MARPEGDVLKSAPIFAKRNFIFCAAIQIIENDSRQSPTSQGPEILYADDPWRPNSTCCSVGHPQKISAGDVMDKERFGI